MEQKKKMSRFEHAILSVVDPEKAKTIEVKTEAEELQERKDNLMKQASRLQVDRENFNTQTPIQ